MDIGGTTMKAGVVSAGGVVLAARSVPTPHTPEASDDALVALVTSLRAEHEVCGVGLAVAGLICADRTTVMFAPHLAWRDSAVPDRLRSKIGLPVVMDHDVNAAAWAEYSAGAARGAKVALLIALGTGIGAGLVIDGSLFRGSYGAAPELGHVRVVPDGRECPCGKRGCWERYCSGTALAATAIELATAITPGRTWGSRTRQLAPDSAPVTGASVGHAARAGDEVALAAVADLALWLGRGLSLAIDVFDPDTIVIGGGVSKIADLFLPAAIALAFGPDGMTGAGHRPVPSVVAAHFADSAGVVGAALLARCEQE
ncbi:ROK family protein [Nakamurella antarctica]|uniref:ROK family protein n=1 Tax=Nakamurella antarctica TaxID=1902245 RepID=A0A3G8ZQC4_9ACTN|nr:ROK family protein [Nakamurella antarctica]